MKKIFTPLLCLFLFIGIGFAQESSPKGEWLLDDVKIDIQQVEDAPSLSTENFIWRDVYREKLPVVFSPDGQLVFQQDEELEVCTYRVEGQDLYFYFTNAAGRVSSTVYQFDRQRDELILTRKDPLVHERYRFIRK